MDTGE